MARGAVGSKEFAAFVNGLGPQTPKRVSKLDVAFEKQLVKKKPS